MPRYSRDEDDLDQDSPATPNASRVALAALLSFLALAAVGLVAYAGWQLMARNQRAAAVIAKLEAEKVALAAAVAAAPSKPPPEVSPIQKQPEKAVEPPPANPRGVTQPPRQQPVVTPTPKPPETEKPNAGKIERKRAAMPARPISLNPKMLTIGDVGKLDTQTAEGVNSFVEAYYEIDRILGDDEMVVSPTRRGFTSHSFIVRRRTNGLAENRKVRFEGYWEVVETKKVGGRTYYVVEPAQE